MTDTTIGLIWASITAAVGVLQGVDIVSVTLGGVLYTLTAWDVAITGAFFGLIVAAISAIVRPVGGVDDD